MYSARGMQFSTVIINLFATFDRIQIKRAIINQLCWRIIVIIKRNYIYYPQNVLKYGKNNGQLILSTPCMRLVQHELIWFQSLQFNYPSSSFSSVTGPLKLFVIWFAFYYPPTNQPANQLIINDAASQACLLCSWSTLTAASLRFLFASWVVDVDIERSVALLTANHCAVAFLVGWSV